MLVRLNQISPARLFEERSFLGQTDNGDFECTGDICVPIVARVDLSGAQQIKTQFDSATPDCIAKSGGSSLFNEVSEKINKVLSGQVTSIGLTKPQAGFVTSVQNCSKPSNSVPITKLEPTSIPSQNPGTNAPVSEASPAATANEWKTPVAIGAGVAVLGLLLLLARG